MQDIVMCGIPRSGSTVVWQILDSVFPKMNIPKTHPIDWEPDGSMVIASVREPHDVAASLLRVRMSRYRDEREVVDDDIVTVVRRTIMSFNLLEEMLVGPHAPILRYEEFYNDHSPIYKMIEDTFGIITPPNIQHRISGKFSVEQNKKRADVLESFNEVDRYQVHGDHIGQVVPGYWKEYIPGRYLEWVCDNLDEIGVRWEYENK